VPIDIVTSRSGISDGAGEAAETPAGEAAERASPGFVALTRYVTAVKLANLTREPVLLDPRDLRGRWLTATFQHARLFPAGSEADTQLASTSSPPGVV
jgi:Protein of unknown function (DUF3438).